MPIVSGHRPSFLIDRRVANGTDFVIDGSRAGSGATDLAPGILAFMAVLKGVGAVIAAVMFAVFRTPLTTQIAVIRQSRGQPQYRQ